MTSEYRRFLESKAWTSPRTGLDDVPTLHVPECRLAAEHGVSTIEDLKH